MKITIKNCAKISEATINVNGLTVIAGDNNTGKSTIGKVMFSVFNSLYDIENKVIRQRKSKIYKICNMYLRDLLRFYSDKKFQNEDDVYEFLLWDQMDEINREIAESLCEVSKGDFSKEKFIAVNKTAFEKKGIKLKEKGLPGFLDEAYNSVKSVVSSDNEAIAEELVYNYFNRVFAQQVCSLCKDETQTTISLSIQKMPINITIGNKSASVQRKLSIMHEAYLIDDPLIIDELEYYSSRPIMSRVAATKGFLLNKINDAVNDTNERVFDSIKAKKKLAKTMPMILDVIPGRIFSKGGKWTLSSEHYKKPVDFKNLSAGVKSFVLVELLLEVGILKEKDILILDEPEIHLHPSWLIKYAEIIVLLQKQFDLSIIVTTHNRDFLEALELYSKKYEIQDKCNYYLSSTENGFSTFEDVTDDLNRIYRQMITPTMLLDSLRSSLEDDKND